MNRETTLAALRDAEQRLTFVRVDAEAMAEKAAVSAVSLRSYLRRLSDAIEFTDTNGSKYILALFENSYKKLAELEDQIADICVTKNANEASDALDCAISQVRSIPTDTHPLTDPTVRKQVFNLTGGKCAYCDTQLVESGGEQDQFCVEHVVPASMGGPNHLVNYVPSCRSCNNSKGDRHVLYFIRNSFVLRNRAPAPVSPITPIAEAAE